MIELTRTTSEDLDFQNLVAMLDKDLKIRDGAEHSFYAQYNKIDSIRNAVVCYVENVAVGCGAFKEYEEGIVEIKRMYVAPEHRGQRLAAKILAELEKWAFELGYKGFILETGKKQPEAIKLYTNSGYARIPNFGQYENVENSVCMKKTLL